MANGGGRVGDERGGNLMKKCCLVMNEEQWPVRRRGQGKDIGGVAMRTAEVAT